jgi:aryl-alcohol dehydrogenase-like predicted oxidoreductase
MKRRHFIAQGAAGALGLGLAGCGMKPKPVDIQKTKLNWEPFSFEPTVSKPQGTMPTGELGKTGIKLSKFGFGSHMREDVTKYTGERQRIIREAYDLGVRVFDIYDKEQNCFQYEPMGKYIEPFNKDVVLSIAFLPYDNRNFEQEFERDLRLLKRDCIDMVRLHAYDTAHPQWGEWEKVFKMKEKGHIRAVGIPIHDRKDLDLVLKNYPLDYVIFPYNFYHNIGWHDPNKPQWDNFDPLPNMLRDKGIGVITMKAFAGDFLVGPLRSIAKDYKESREVDFTQAAMRYVINSPIQPDATFTGMYNMDHLYRNVGAYFKPAMASEERVLLKRVRDAARMVARSYLPEYYRFLENWAAKTSDLDEVKLG